ncbi:hypothetical protein P8452_42602 [Trifolium repens]|nr:hypothetical protein P8452_42602 [Trifolium repens]
MVEGETVLKFALCYDFRNLQNIVRKLKTGKYDYHFLEIMACPSDTTKKFYGRNKLSNEVSVVIVPGMYIMEHVDKRLLV